MIKKILFTASESVPYVKTGGLADVVGSLPIALKKKGYEVSVVLPLYSKIIQKHMGDLKQEFEFSLKEHIYDSNVRVFSDEHEGIKFFFIENRHYFERDELYGYDDDGERFAFFQLAIYKMIIESKNYPDIIHSHDWHTGMMPALARLSYHNNSQIKKIKHIFTIHNLAYQGNFGKDMLESCLGIPISLFYDGTLRFKNGISFMKAGISFANKINTVSNTYAKEILSIEHGEGMQDILKLREYDLWGILNGIDTKEFNPKTDKFIKQNYDLKSLDNKYLNKMDLQNKLGLVSDAKTCVIGMVSRLTWQKGISLILEKIPEILEMDVRLIILGTGDEHYERALRDCENNNKGKMVYYGAYSEKTAREIFAGSDLLLMPSKFEPCGISQQIAMRYGTLPVVRETGGLKDTVIPYNQYDKTGTGFSFSGFNSEDFIKVLKIAVNTYYQKHEDFRLLQKNSMLLDLSWEKSADLYIKMYNMA